MIKTTHELRFELSFQTKPNSPPEHHGFISAEQQAAYLAFEKKHIYNQFKAYAAAMTKQDREDAAVELGKARLRNYHIWIRQYEPPSTEPMRIA